MARTLLTPWRLLLGAVMAATPTLAQAQNASCTSLGTANLIQNCSFEAPGLGSGGWQFTNNITGWTSNSGHFERWYGNDGFASRDGRAHLELDVDANEAGRVMNTTIWQVIGTEAGRTYDVFFSIAHRRKGNDNAFSQIGLMVDLTGAPITAALTPYQTTAKYFNDQSYQVQPVATEWKDYAFRFTATGANTTIGFRALGTANEYGDHLDNIGVVGRPVPVIVNVPEPASLALVAVGLGLVGVRSRRRPQA